MGLKLVSRLEFGAGAVAMRYKPRRSGFFEHFLRGDLA
jgi:hypothetical protein